MCFPAAPPTFQWRAMGNHVAAMQKSVPMCSMCYSTPALVRTGAFFACPPCGITPTCAQGLKKRDHLTTSEYIKKTTTQPLFVITQNIKRYTSNLHQSSNTVFEFLIPHAFLEVYHFLGSFSRDVPFSEFNFTTCFV